MTRGVLALLAALASQAHAQTQAPVPPPPARWVEDQVGFLSASTRARLDARLEGYQNATGHQVVVWIGRSLGGAALDDWATRTFTAWKVGRKGFDDGVAMFVIPDDRAVYIAVGYGLEAKVPDVTAARIIRDVMAPQLRAGHADEAVTQGVDALLAAIEGRPWAGSGGDRVVGPGGGGGGSGRGGSGGGALSPVRIVLGALLALALLILAVTHPRLAMLFLWSIFSGRGGGFGGGFGGGGGGGFSGGGGRTGGGGAGGHW
jgi:uncharacterized protein